MDKIDGIYRWLDVTQADVRKAVIDFIGKPKELYLNDVIALDYK